MPFYQIDKMESKKDSAGGPASAKSVPGEFMKAGVVTYQIGDGPNPHFHPNEEQFILMLEGTLRMILGDEVRDIRKGDLVHIPRNTRHGVRCVEGPAVFFTCKSPCGDGDLSQAYNKAKDAEQAWSRLSEGMKS